MFTNNQFEQDAVFTEEWKDKLVADRKISVSGWKTADGEVIGKWFWFRDSKGSMLGIGVLDNETIQVGGEIYLDHVDKNKTKWFKMRKPVVIDDELAAMLGCKSDAQIAAEAETAKRKAAAAKAAATKAAKKQAKAA